MSEYRSEVVINDAAIERLFGGAGPVEQYVMRVSTAVWSRSVANAPIGAPSKTPEGHPAGWLAANIRLDWSGDLSMIVSTNAVNSRASHREGDPYARWIERPKERPFKPPPFARNDEPYLLPALDQIVDEINQSSREAE